MNTEGNKRHNSNSDVLIQDYPQANISSLIDSTSIASEGPSANGVREPSISPTWNFALFMADQGRKVFPVEEKGKRPLIEQWQEKATTAKNVILKWAEQLPDSNYGVVTGDGFFVIDFDLNPSDDIDEEILRVQRKLGAFEPGTFVKTGRGYQLYCSSGSFEVRNDQKRLSEKVDVKGAGGYVVGPGSIHPNGARYEFCDASVLQNRITLTKLPDAALHYIVSLQGSSKRSDAASNADLREGDADRRASNQSVLRFVKPIPEGQRNDTLFRIGCHYREINRLQESGIYAILKEINSNDCEVSLSDAELRTIAESCCKYPQGARPPAESTTLIECSEEAQSLFLGNKLIDLFRQNVQKFHVGDEPVSELLMLSVASMSVVNTSGIQPKLSGESGMGKTHDVQTVRHVMHPTMCKSASFSAKALFYDDTLRPKKVLFSDDVTLSPEVEEIVRAAMTDWDTPTEHITLDSKRNPITLHLPSRIIFWLTSVDNKSTIQLQNRQVEINVDETPNQDRRVEEHQRRLAELGLLDFYIDDEVELLREAFLHLNQVDFRVRIPFIRNIRFTDIRNRRNFPIFLDIIKAYCILNYKGREIDEDGMLIAMREDFENAIELFKAVAVQQVTKLSGKERKVALAVKEHSPCDIDTIMDETELSNSYVWEIIHGTKRSGNRGLLEKIPELKCHSRRDINPATNWPWGKNHYELPEDWDIVSSHESIVYWDDSASYESDVINNPNQLRSVSESFGNGFRNSSEREEGLDDDLDPCLGVGCSTSTICFDTSAERETPQAATGSSYVATSDRNTETASNPSTDTSSASSESALNRQTGTYSISEAQSEVDRNIAEANAGRQGTAGSLDCIIEQTLAAIETKHRGQRIDLDLLPTYVSNEVQKASSSYKRETIRERFLELAKRDEKVGCIVDLITRGDFPL
ncbi:MAG: bifunctional DNA primase/polymerase [Halobacteriota archaeon]